WWMRLFIVFVYAVLAVWKAFSWCRSLDLTETWTKLSSKNFSSVMPTPPESEEEAVSNRSYKIQLDGLESEIAYVSLTQVIAPFCLFTVVVSLGRNLDLGMADMGIVYGDTNAIPLMATGFTWFRGIPPGRNMRIAMFLLLACWFGYTMVAHLLRYNWHFVEEAWLNHMVFVTMMSLALRISRCWVVVNMLLHTIFFLSLTLINGSGEYGPSPGSQVLLVSLVGLCINYSQVLSQMVSKKANAEYKLVQAEVVQVKMEKRAMDAEQEARAGEAKEALAQAELADDRRMAAEANSRMVEKMHDAMQNLLLMLCDAVVELDNELRILDQGKLGLVLYQHQKDLAARPFSEFLVSEDVQRFKDMVQTSSRQRVPVSVTMIGSYSMKIRMTVYLSQIDQPDGSCTYVVGICESQEENRPVLGEGNEGNDSENLGQPRFQSFDADVPDIDYFGAKEFESPTSSAPMRGSSSSRYEAIQPMLEEERMQSLLPLLWSWPVPSERSGCCETHRLLDEAASVVEKLKGLECQAAPGCLVWQCPGCKLKGVPGDRDLFNASLGICGRCAAWDMLM
ncbi:unnamed protein product, partial [Cladocopium goreaui]